MNCPLYVLQVNDGSNRISQVAWHYFLMQCYNQNLDRAVGYLYSNYGSKFLEVKFIISDWNSSFNSITFIFTLYLLLLETILQFLIM